MAVLLDLRDVIEVPGASKSFETQLDTQRLQTPSVPEIDAPLTARGSVSNHAGLLRLQSAFRATLHCVCDRCGRAFTRVKPLDVDVPLSGDLEAGEGDGEVFPLEGNSVDVNEVLETCWILDMESKVLCNPDCLGICPQCGKNLNDGPCGCVMEAEADPRMAALRQLLQDFSDSED